MKKGRAGLIFSISVGLTAILTSAVSTFAWYTSNAQATVNVVTNSTIITTNKPDDYVFYSYNGNRSSSFVKNGTFSHDFTAITSSSILDLETDLSGIYPGKALTFAIEISNPSSVSLSVTKIKSNDSVKQGLAQRRKVANQSYNVNVGWAMDVYAQGFTGAAGNAATGYSTYLDDPSSGNTDKFNYSATNNRSVLEAAGDANHVITLGSPLSLFTNGSVSAAYYYIFYTVLFSNDADTFYQEVASDSGSAAAIEIPPASGPRYFKKATTGNSNCYGSLDFALSELKLTIG